MNYLYYGDNIKILRYSYIKDESVDLAYLDGPFKSDTDYNILFKEKDGSKSESQLLAFEDTWHWGEASEKAYEEVVERQGKPSLTLQFFRSLLGENDMMAFLCMMAPRLIELKRVLKPTGLIVVHCDPTAGDFLKILLDSIFLPVNCRNEIIWKRTSNSGGPKSRSKQFARNHDKILIYSKTNSFYSNKQFIPWTPEEIKIYFPRDENDGKGPYSWQALTYPSEEKIKELKEKNEFAEAGVGNKSKYHGYKVFLKNSKGRPIGSIWTDIESVSTGNSKEYRGFQTQKPEKLLERIIKFGCPPQGVVLDPFCGCGTAIIAAETLQLNWIGIDIGYGSIREIKDRLRETFGSNVQYELIGEPISLPDAIELAKQDKHQFQWWALDLVGARPIEKKGLNKKKGTGPDGGEDGVLYFQDELGGRVKKIIFSVKGGEEIGVGDIRDLIGTVDTKKADLGVFISIKRRNENEKLFKNLSKVASMAGFYTSPDGIKLQRIQVITVEELLDGKRIGYQGTNVTFERKRPSSTVARQDVSKFVETSSIENSDKEGFEEDTIGEDQIF